MESECVAGQECSIDLVKFRNLIKCYIDLHQLESALFWADKIVSLSNGEPQDVYTYADILYRTGQYHRASHLLQFYKIDKRFLVGRYLRARCLFACKDFQEALNVLDQTENMCPGSGKTTEKKEMEKSQPGMPSSDIESALSLLRGKIYEAMDNRSLAVECFRDALCQDVRCYEAFENLVQHHMLSADEEKQLMDLLPFNKQCTTEESNLLRFLYENLLKKYNKPPEIPDSFSLLANNYDVIVTDAERYYYNSNFYESYKITSEVLKMDPYNSMCLPLHIAVLVELKKLNELFYLAHKLVDLYPNNAVAWLAVGCYYFLANKHEPARRYLSKATTLNRVFGPAWLIYGHSFAAENEHDQAMAAYFTASQLMKGCHLPLLYIGLEYGLTNNSKLAERFFTQALQIAPEDPFVLHEIGVIAFQSQQYEDAEKHFLSALEKIQSSNHDAFADKWEPLLNNLGHVSRKLKKYDEALHYHQQSLVLCPYNASTFSALGYAYSLKGDFAEAVKCFHKALGLRKDDSFTTTMLNNVIEQMMLETKPCEDLPDVLPTFTYNNPLIDMVKMTAQGQPEPIAELSELVEYEESDMFSLHHGLPDIQDTEMEDI